jgi:GNAT superfamily N-acetyltransferase
MNDDSITIRRATPHDSRAAFDLTMDSVLDFLRRNGVEWDLDRDAFFAGMGPVLDHFATHNAEWWVAEASDGSLVGHARSIERGGLFELTEFFVRPDSQSAGVGRRLIEKAFPNDRGEVRAIVATIEPRAQATYYRAGTAARFSIAEMAGAPKASAAEAAQARNDAGLDLEVDDVGAVADFAALDEAVTGFPRTDEYPLLFETRDALLFRRAGRPAAFAFTSEIGSGPIAALEPADIVPILLEIEARAAARGQTEIEFEVPMINEVAMRHLLGRGFRIAPPLTLFMASKPFGQFDRYILFGPPIAF